MTDYKLGVVLLTYGRLEYARRTLSSTLAGMMHESAVLVHIASDGDSSEYIDTLCEVAGRHGNVGYVSQSNSQRGGYGANYNLAMQTVHAACEYVLALEDDWELRRSFHASRLIEEMEELGVGCARLGYLGYTQELKCSFASAGGHYWLRLDPDSPEPHVFAGHPRIEARWWARGVGPWPEGMLPGETEFAVAHRRAARENVGWPLSLVQPHGDLYAHIGTNRSY